MPLNTFFPIFVSAGLVIFAHGLYGILVPVRAQIEGFSPTAIGVIATGFAFGFTAGCFYIPRLVSKVGHIRAFGAISSVLSCSIILSIMFISPVAWFITRVIAGACIAGTFMIMESWLNERTTNSNRGSVFSIYMIISQTGLLVGQFVLALDDPKEAILFLVAAMAFSFAVLPTAVTGVQSPAPLSKVSINIRELYDNSQVAVVGSFLAGIIAGAWVSFAPVFGQQVGFSTTEIASMMGAAMVGGICFQYPIGRLSDRVDRRMVMIGCGIAGAIFGSMLYGVSQSSGADSWMFYAVVFLLGSVLFTIYSLFVAHAHDYSSDFVATSSGLLVIYGVGTMVGPLATAYLLETVGPSGLFAVTSISHIGIAIFATYRLFRRAHPEDLETTDFQTIGLARTNTPQTYEFDPRSEEESS